MLHQRVEDSDDTDDESEELEFCLKTPRVSRIPVINSPANLIKISSTSTLRAERLHPDNCSEESTNDTDTSSELSSSIEDKEIENVEENDTELGNAVR